MIGGEEEMIGIFYSGVELRCVVGEAQGGGGIVKNLARCEEPFQLGCGVLGTGRGVDDIFLIGHREVSTYGARGSLTSVGSSGHGAYHTDGLYSAQTHHYDGCGGHRGFDVGEKGEIDKVGVMLAQNLGGECHHFHACYHEPFTLEAAENLSDE